MRASTYKMEGLDRQAMSSDFYQEPDNITRGVCLPQGGNAMEVPDDTFFKLEVTTVHVMPFKRYGPGFAMSFDPEILVQDFKEEACMLVPEMPDNNLKMVHAGKILEDSMPMKAYKIKDGDRVVVYVVKKKSLATKPSDPKARPASEFNFKKLTSTIEVEKKFKYFEGTPSYEPLILDLMHFGFKRDYVEACIREAFGNADVSADYEMPKEVTLAGEDGFLKVNVSGSKAEFVEFIKGCDMPNELRTVRVPGEDEYMLVTSQPKEDTKPRFFTDNFFTDNFLTNNFFTRNFFTNPSVPHNDDDEEFPDIVGGSSSEHKDAATGSPALRLTLSCGSRDVSETSEHKDDESSSSSSEEESSSSEEAVSSYQGRRRRQ